MKILVTGAKGFIGKNLITQLNNCKYEVLEYDIDNTELELKSMIKKCDFVMHLAGVNRPLTTDEFYNGNVNFTYKLVEYLKESKRSIPMLFSSSIQAEKNNDYGKSKREAEELIFKYGRETGAAVYVFRLANAFGKWSRPNYNSVIATFCYNVANDIGITINDEDAMIPFIYIDDIVKGFMSCINGNGAKEILSIDPIYEKTIGEVAKIIKSFKESRNNLLVVDMGNPFVKALYSTYLSYLKDNEFSYPLKMNVDQRGSFSEFLKTVNNGQVSINVAKPGITKGNHWHHSKNEKFLVVSGDAVIRFRKIGESKIIEYNVTGEKFEVVDIPCGYTHNIENVGTTDLVTVMWANELFDSENPDTFYEEI